MVVLAGLYYWASCCGSSHVWKGTGFAAILLGRSLCMQASMIFAVTDS